MEERQRIRSDHGLEAGEHCAGSVPPRQPAGPFVTKVTLPGPGVSEVGLYAQDANGVAPSPNMVRVSDLQNVLEVEPNDALAQATPGVAPSAMNGIIEKPGDIDHFKFYNDHYGHAGGDECLRRVAQALAGCSRRAGDLVSRFGGEEFAVLLPGADSAAASKVAQTCLDAIRDVQIVHATSSVGPWLSVSIGVASVGVNAARPALSLIERADAALYRAKHLGRGRYETLGSSAAV